MIAESDFDAEHFRNQEKFFANGTAHGCRRIGIVAGIHPGCHSLFGQRTNLTEEVFERTGDAVGAGDPHQAGGAAGN